LTGLSYGSGARGYNGCEYDAGVGHEGVRSGSDHCYGEVQVQPHHDDQNRSPLVQDRFRTRRNRKQPETRQLDFFLLIEAKYKTKQLKVEMTRLRYLSDRVIYHTILVAYCCQVVFFFSSNQVSALVG